MLIPSNTTEKLINGLLVDRYIISNTLFNISNITNYYNINKTNVFVFMYIRSCML